MFERILACLDGSGTAEEILPYVTEEALAHHSKVVLLRVVSMPETIISINLPGEPGVPVSTEGSARRAGKEEAEAEEYLKRIAGPMRKQGITVQHAVVHGIPGNTIVNHARENDCQLIAIATHGHGGIRRLVLGSTADFVLHNSSLPLLMVRPGNKPASP